MSIGGLVERWYCVIEGWSNPRAWMITLSLLRISGFRFDPSLGAHEADPADLTVTGTELKSSNAASFVMPAAANQRQATPSLTQGHRGR
jgi:hypothetical protein